jgi:hypothetical protein
MLDSPSGQCIDVDLEGVAALELDGAIAVVDGGTSLIRDTTWRAFHVVVRVYRHCLYELHCVAT